MSCAGGAPGECTGVSRIELQSETTSQVGLAGGWVKLVAGLGWWGWVGRAGWVRQNQLNAVVIRKPMPSMISSASLKQSQSSWGVTKQTIEAERPIALVRIFATFYVFV